MMTEMSDNLPELRDIHLPDGVSAFPPAYGWFVIAGGIIAAVLLWKLYLLVLKKSRKRYALSLLDGLPPSSISSAAEMSKILRRICVYKYKTAAALSGRDWIEFLNSHTKHPISGKAQELLLNAPYISKTSSKYNEEEIKEIRRFCREWIGENL